LGGDDQEQGAMRTPRRGTVIGARGILTLLVAQEIAAMTPSRLVELECPKCRAKHWVIDSDYRGSSMLGQPERTYGERDYACRECRYSGRGFHVLAKSPPEFLEQLHPMSQADFDYWVSVLRKHFPDYPLLKRLGKEFRPNTNWPTDPWRDSG